MQLGGCPQTVAPALSMGSRVLSMPQNLDRDSGREQEIPGCHSLSRHTHTILQRGLKGLQPLPRNGAQGSQTCHLLQLARMLYMSIWKPQKFASDSTGICFPSTDQSQRALPVPPQCRPIGTWFMLGLLSHPRPPSGLHQHPLLPALVCLHLLINLAHLSLAEPQTSDLVPPV